MSYPLLMAIAENYYKSVRVGDSEAHLGPTMICAILRPFTPGEDAVATWIVAQDATRLIDIVHLTDGRDFCVFERLYLTQSYEQARAESDAHIASIIARIPKQHDTNNTPNK